jgi:hypothetical protein
MMARRESATGMAKELKVLQERECERQWALGTEGHGPWAFY